MASHQIDAEKFIEGTNHYYNYYLVEGSGMLMSHDEMREKISRYNDGERDEDLVCELVRMDAFKSVLR